MKKRNKILCLVSVIVMLVIMMSFAAISAAAEDAYKYPGNHKQDEGYYYIRNVGRDGYLAATTVDGKIRFSIQDKGDVFQIKKVQLAEGKEEVYAYQIIVVTSPVATAGHTLRVSKLDNGWPDDGTEIDESFDYNLWHQRWAFDNAGDGQVYIRTYLDNSDEYGKGIDGKHPYLDIKNPVTNDSVACLYAKSNSKNQVWVLEEPLSIEGHGLADDPYLISTSEQLSKLAKIAASGQCDCDVYYKLTQDINYSGEPIGTINHPFSGFFDGGNHTVTLSIDKKGATFVGLFGVTKVATIENLNIAGSVSGKNCVGGVVGFGDNRTQINECHVTASVTGDAENVGGIVGMLYYDSTVGSCHVDATVKGGWSSVGGIAGWMHNSCSITSSKKTGETIGESAVGGIAGYARGQHAYIMNCSSDGKITATKNAGGILGLADSYDGEVGKVVIDNCHVTASVTGTEENIGGVAGNICKMEVTSTIENSSSTGLVSGKTGVGGIIGNAEKDILINNCYVAASVTGADGNVGGVAGILFNSTVSNSRVDASVTTTGKKNNTGGIVGWLHNDSKVINCVKTGETIGYDSVGGIAGYISEGNPAIVNCLSLGKIDNPKGVNGHYFGGIAGLIDSDPATFTLVCCFSNCNVGGTYAHGYIIGNNNKSVSIGYGFTAQEIYCVENGDPKEFNNWGQGGQIKVITINASDFADTRDAINSYIDEELKVFNGVALTHWSAENGNLYPESCTGFKVKDPQNGTSGIGSILSDGTVCIIGGIAVLAACAVAAVVIVTKKKKKTALASGTEKESEE